MPGLPPFRGPVSPATTRTTRPTTTGTRQWRVALASTALLLALLTTTAHAAEVRLCVGAGPLFPETAEGLRNAVVKMLDEAQAPEPTRPLLATLVPHGPYGISGKVAASAFKHLKKGQFDRVIVLGASHAEAAFQGCSIAAVDAYATPMGLVPVDGKSVRKLCYSALFNTRSLRYPHLQRGFLTESDRKPLHEFEHSIEAVLPFLQEQLGSFELVPILVGELTDGSDRYNEMRTRAVASIIRDIMDEKTLLVVSSDFVHFGNDFGYRPFNTDIFQRIDRLDEAGLQQLAANDLAGFEEFLKATKAPICGLNALRVLMQLLPDRARGQLLARTTSGQFYDNPERSISYAAMNFYLSDESQRPKVVAPPEPEEKVIPKATDKAPVTLSNTGGRGLE